MPARATSNNFEHTYHTQVHGRAEITLRTRSAAGELLSEKKKTVEYESGFIEGDVSDEGPSGELAIYETKVLAAIGDAKILDHQTDTKLEFDHFESSNMIDFSGESEEGSVNKHLKIHEYQIYRGTDVYLAEKTEAPLLPGSPSEPPEAPELPASSEPVPSEAEPMPSEDQSLPEPIAESPEAEKKQNAFLWWILPAALVLCAGLGAGGYFLWKKKKSN